MFPDWLSIRIALRIAIGFLTLIAPLAFLVVGFTLKYTWPAPFLALVAPHWTIAHPRLAWTFNVYAASEVGFWFTDRAVRYWVEHSGRGAPALSQEERWELVRKVAGAEEDTWNGFLASWFTYKHNVLPSSESKPSEHSDEGASGSNEEAGRATKDDASTQGNGRFRARDWRNEDHHAYVREIEHPRVGAEKEDVGHDDVAEWLSAMFFNRTLTELRKDDQLSEELDSMVIYLASGMQPPNYTFQTGRSGKVTSFKPYFDRFRTRHCPLLFYACTSLLAQGGDLIMWLCGFRHYGQASGLMLPPVFMRRSLSADARARLPEPRTEQEISDKNLAKRVGYWYYPGAKGKENALPIVYMHGMSGTYGPLAFIIMLARITGRPVFIPEFPYVMMRLHWPGLIIVRRQTALAVKAMLAARGFKQSIMVGHSLGSVPLAWLRHDAPELCAGAVLVDPSSIVLHRAHCCRNFFRQNPRTAASIFFEYFAKERAMGHFMGRHLEFSDSMLFAPTHVRPPPPIPPQYITHERTEANKNHVYGPTLPDKQYVTVYVSCNDCIVPADLVKQYCDKTGIDCVEMEHLDHATVLFSPYWLKTICHRTEEISADLESALRETKAR
ncbi:uncharacterized protein L969DRAFT_93013 [Mixia osmundae IAM 14324]|uniref:AB hydrolase-1 domain-containing protein n=1 Tax=Mixia osmundae (strain CBS 9802 / IAM 14324 / JCM 22182 / KY 12970) TaxID=764103 RepID=G7E6D2_MIXOS|nr:uncharacterized protein L969DRAFT_93013 [Mixia osmundae IAM 14324]KEI40451.1 hypothetical protein L969DRAFT_93013 [Mixia osmundae IAM 14324]GAA98392.1 hypothetical protein E5Q_05078 [Mixia osmundae IAM 14324]